MHDDDPGYPVHDPVDRPYEEDRPLSMLAEREEWAALTRFNALDLLPREELAASIRYLAQRLLDLTVGYLDDDGDGSFDAEEEARRCQMAVYAIDVDDLNRAAGLLYGVQSRIAGEFLRRLDRS